jgi:uncharacterized ion transporter superfamily protein YfcC
VLKKVPDVFVIVFALIVLAAVLTWIVPGGSYERKEVEVGGSVREVIDDSQPFRYEASTPQTYQVFTAPINGFLRHGITDIVVFIFLVGGAFFVLNETGAITAGITQLVRLLEGKEILIIPVVMTIFSLFGAAFGMCEEAIPFALIFVPMAIALGYDSLVGVSLTFLAAGVGFAGAFFNPFTLQIAQGLSGVRLTSGMEYRLVVWAIATAVTIAWVMVYAARIKAEPSRSIMYELDQARRDEIDARQQEVGEFTLRHGLILVLLLAVIVLMIVGVVRWDWFIVEIAGLFFAMGILAGAISGMGPNRLAKSFIDGCKDIAGAALIVGFAGGILHILESGNIMDTILHAMGTVTSQLPGIVSAWAMYGVQLVLNFFIPSGSTKAALTMPLMAPLADLSGITRQTAVLAYQFGDGFTNMIIPTSGVTVGTLALAKIPFEKWFRWNLPMQGMFIAMSLLFLVWPVLTAWE